MQMLYINGKAEKIIFQIKEYWLKLKAYSLVKFLKNDEIMTEELEVTQELLDKVSKFSGELQPLLQGAFGFFTTKTRFAVSYQDIDIRNKVQGELDHAVALLAIAHVMTIFEDSFPNNYWEEIINDSDSYNILKAYKHIRNSTIKGFTGFRSDDDGDEYDCFNQVMNSNNPLKGIKSFDDKKIFLAESAGSFAHSFITGLMNKIIVELHKRL